MDNWNVLLVIITLLGFIGTSYTMFYKPSHELKIEIVKLTENLSTLKENDQKQSVMLDSHAIWLHDHDKRLENVDYRIEQLEKVQFVKYRE